MTAPGTQDVYLRGMPRDLWRRVRAAAAFREMSLREIVVQALTLWLDREET